MTRQAPRRKPASAAATRPAGNGASQPPLYHQITRALRAQIEAGDFAVGDAFPTESDLSARFSASRHTIREALRRLAELGLIERRQGAGTRVISLQPKAHYVHSVGSLVELFQFARETTLEVFETRLTVLSAEDAAEVQVPPGSRWLRVEAMRRATGDRDAICYVTLFVHARFAPLLADIASVHGALFTVLEARSGERVATVMQEIAARPMPRDAARALHLRAGAPALKIARRYLDASGGPMLVALNWHPADEFSYVIELRRGDDGHPE